MTKISISGPFYNLLIAALLLLSGSGCFDGAPHSHPLDPRGSEFENVGSVSGNATRFYPPFEGIDGVEIRLSPGTYLGISDNQGMFSLFDVPPGSYALTASKNGFSTLLDSVDIMTGDQEEVVLRLNGLPRLESFELSSVHISRWWPPPFDQYRLNITVRASDVDGIADLATSYIMIPFLQMTDTLRAGAEPGLFEISLDENQLGLGVEALLGHEFKVFIQDRAGFTVEIPDIRMSRVIRETPIANTPGELVNLTTPMPEFSWTALDLNYPFTYRVDITRVDANIQTLVQSITGISSDSTSARAMESLLPGEYFWTVSVVDEFGNRSRSREAGFRIL